MSLIVGIDLGGSSVKAVAVTEEGEVRQQFNRSFDPAKEMSWAHTITEIVHEIPGGIQNRIGLSAPGLAAPDRRSIAVMPGRLKGLEGLVWKDYLKGAHPVPVVNDAHAAILGETWLGAARGAKNVTMLTLGTGVGGAAIVDGRLLLGHIGRAGHLGHASLDPNGTPDVTGTPGSLEMAIGNCTIPQRGGGRYESTHHLVAEYQAGNPDAARVWLESVKALAAAVASFINILDPEVVVIGGGISASGPALFGPLAGFLDSMEWRPAGHQARIVMAQLGELAGAFGAAWSGLKEDH